jgi:hypothetical protein
LKARGAFILKMVNLFFRISSFAASKLRSIDRFASKISLTFNQSDSFQTIAGGIGTLALYVIVSLVGIVLLVELFQKTSISATQTFIYKNLVNSTEAYQISKDGVAFGFRVQHINGTIADESIGYFVVTETTYIRSFDEDSPLRNMTERKFDLEP